MISLNKGHATMNVDDTSITKSSGDIEDINLVLNYELASFYEWLQGNKFSLNVVNTQSMVVGSRPNLKKNDDSNFSIGGEQIEVGDLVLCTCGFP